MAAHGVALEKAAGFLARPPVRQAHHESLHEEFKRRIKTQTVLPSAETAAMLFWALLAAGQINLRKIDGWQSMATIAIAQPIDLAA
jgi:putative transposase